MKCQNQYFKSILLDFCVLSVAMLVIRARLAGVDINYINSDTLYFALLNDFNFIEFRPASNSFLFPDYAIYRFINLLSGSQLESLKLLGVFQVFVVSTLAYYLSDRATWLLIMVIGMYFPEFTYFSVESHVGFILLSLIFIFTEGRVRGISILVGGVSDPLFLTVPCLYYLQGAISKTHIHKTRITITIAASWMLSFSLSESTKELLITAPALLIWILFFHNLHTLFSAVAPPLRESASLRPISVFLLSPECLFVTLVVLGSAICLSGMPLRYGIPMMATGAMLAHKDRKKTPMKFQRSLIISLLSVLSLSPLLARAYQIPKAMGKDLACLRSALEQQHIDEVGVDYWLSKPLYYANPRLKVIPMDYTCGEPYVWVAPYEFGSGSVRQFIIDNKLCEPHDRSLRKHCDREWLQQNTTHHGVFCEHYTIYSSEDLLSFEHPKSKLRSFLKHSFKNMRKIGGGNC